MRYQKGQSGNPAGRPKGARDKRPRLYTLPRPVAEPRPMLPLEIIAARDQVLNPPAPLPPHIRSGVVKMLQDLARTHTDKAIETLIRCMDCEQAAVAVSAATALLDRGYGRPHQSISADLNVSLALAEQLEAARARAMGLLTIEGRALPAPRMIEPVGAAPIEAEPARDHAAEPVTLAADRAEPATLAELLGNEP